MALELQAIHQSQRAKRLFAEASVQKARGLIPKLGHPLSHQRSVHLVVVVHALDHPRRLTDFDESLYSGRIRSKKNNEK